MTLRRVLVEISVTEQRHQAALDVRAGSTVTDVAGRFGVSRQAVHRWLAWYEQEGLTGLADRSSRPRSSPAQTAPEVEALICELRRNHPRWGARRVLFELGRIGCPGPIPSRITVHRVLVRHRLIDERPRRRRREDYQRWERDRPMELWQMDIVGGVQLVGGREAKVVTGVDDHSRFCMIAAVVPKATGRAVCLALVAALREYGVPEELLTDNGKQFTARFNAGGGEVMFDRICRENAITHRLTKPRSPTTTGTVERFHLSLRRELLDEHPPFASVAEAQAAIDVFRQAVTTGAAIEVEVEVEVERTVNACGLLALAGRQHPVGYHLAGRRVTARLDHGVLHLLDTDRTVLRSLPNPLTAADLRRIRDARPAGPAPAPATGLLRVARRVSCRGSISIARQKIQVGIGHAGRTVTVEEADTTFRIYDGDQLLAEVIRTTTKQVARFKARKPEPPRHGGPGNGARDDRRIGCPDHHPDGMVKTCPITAPRSICPPQPLAAAGKCSGPRSSTWSAGQPSPASASPEPRPGWPQHA